MKKYIFTLLFLVSFSCLSQNVSDKKMALFSKTTATWCGNCGTWGWTLFDDVYLDETLPKFVSIKLHSSSSSDLYSADASALVQALGITSGQPRFNVNLDLVSGTSATAAADIKSMIESTGQLDADINAGFNLEILDNNEITVQTKTKVFNAVSGEYYLGVYLAEKDVVNFQAGQGANAVHKIVLRNALTENVTGDLIGSGDLEAGAEFENTYNFTLPDGINTDNIQIFVAIWKKVGDAFVYESAFTKTQEEQALEEEEDEVVAGIEDVQLNFDFNITNDNGSPFYRINAIEDNQDIKVDLYNSNGQLVKNLYEGSTSTELSGSIASSDLPKGIYLVRAIVGDQVKTLQIVL